jgi:hypothetical protein
MFRIHSSVFLNTSITTCPIFANNVFIHSRISEKRPWNKSANIPAMVFNDSKAPETIIQIFSKLVTNIQLIISRVIFSTAIISSPRFAQNALIASSPVVILVPIKSIAFVIYGIMKSTTAFVFS